MALLQGLMPKKKTQPTLQPATGTTTGVQGLQPTGITGKKTFTPAATTGYQDKEQDVGNIAGDMMKTDSLLMQQAAADGLQQTNSRGMMNSSIGVTASQDAMLKQIVPMASQTAAQNADNNLSNQQFLEGSAMSSQEAGQASQLQKEAARQERRLSKQEYEQTSALSKQEYEQTSKLAYEDFTYDRELMELDHEQQLVLQEQGFNYEMQLQNDKQAFDKAVADMELDAQAAAQADAAVASVWDDYTASVNQIMANPDLTAAQRQDQLDAAEELAMDRLQAIEATYGNEYGYDMPPTNIYANPNNNTGGTSTKPKEGDTRTTANGTKQVYKDGKWVNKSSTSGSSSGGTKTATYQNGDWVYS